MPVSPVEPAASSVLSLPAMPEVMTPQMFSGYLPDTSVRTLQDWRYRGVGPAFVRDPNTRRVFYLKPDVLRWLTAARHETTN